MTIATIINYCTNNYRFLSQCIKEVKHFSKSILIPVCDHFFNGEKENRNLLNHSYAKHLDCQFIEFAYTPNKLYTPFPSYRPEDDEWIRLWHQTARYIGFLHLPPEIEYVLFLDCDEIAEGKRLAKYLQTSDYQNFNALRFSSYYYVIRPTLRAVAIQNTALLIKRASLKKEGFLHSDERFALYENHAKLPKKLHVDDFDHTPFFHHYSWVHPLEECLHKSKSWGHRNLTHWEDEIKNSFAEKSHQHLFGNTNYAFEEIPNAYFDPLSVPIPKQPLENSIFSHVKKVTSRDIFSMELDAIL